MESNLRNLRYDLGLTQDELDKTIEKFKAMNAETSDKMALQYGQLRRRELAGVLTDSEKLALEEYNKLLSEDLYNESELLNLASYSEFIDKLNEEKAAQEEAITRAYTDLQSRAIIMAADTSGTFSQEEKDAIADQIAYYEKISNLLERGYENLAQKGYSKFEKTFRDRVTAAADGFNLNIVYESVLGAMKNLSDTGSDAAKEELNSSLLSLLSFIPDSVADVSQEIRSMSEEELVAELSKYDLQPSQLKRIPYELAAKLEKYSGSVSEEVVKQVNKKLVNQNEFDFMRLFLQASKSAEEYDINKDIEVTTSGIKFTGIAARSSSVHENLLALAQATWGEANVTSTRGDEISVSFSVAVAPNFTSVVKKTKGDAVKRLEEVSKTVARDKAISDAANRITEAYMSNVFSDLDPESGEYSAEYSKHFEKVRETCLNSYKRTGNISADGFVTAFVDNFNSSSEFIAALESSIDDSNKVFAYIGEDGYYQYKTAFELTASMDPIQLFDSVEKSDDALYNQGLANGSLYIAGINKALASEGLDADTFSSFLANSQSYVEYFAKQERDAINQILDDNQKGIIQALQNFNFSELTSIFGGDANLALRTAATSVSTNAKLENIKNNNQYAGTRLSSYLSDTESGINIENKVYIGDTEIRDFITETLIDNNLVTG